MDFTQEYTLGMGAPEALPEYILTELPQKTLDPTNPPPSSSAYSHYRISMTSEFEA